MNRMIFLYRCLDFCWYHLNIWWYQQFGRVFPCCTIIYGKIMTIEYITTWENSSKRWRIYIIGLISIRNIPYFWLISLLVDHRVLIYAIKSHLYFIHYFKVIFHSLIYNEINNEIWMREGVILEYVILCSVQFDDRSFATIHQRLSYKKNARFQ